jgi:outer membrane protein
MRKIQIVSVLILLLSSNMSWSQVKTFSLEEAIACALKNKAEAKNAKLSIEEARARNMEIITTGLPQITGNMDYNYFYKRPLAPAIQRIFGGQTDGTIMLYRGLSNMATDPQFKAFLDGSIQALESQRGQPIYFQMPHNVSATIQLTQLIVDGRYFFGIKAAKDLMKTAMISKNLSDLEVRYNVKKAYYQALAAQSASILLKENLQVVLKLLADTREVYKAGFIEELDVDRLELIVANLQSQITTQTQMAEIAMSNLKFQMGISVREQIILTDKMETLREQLSTELEDFDIQRRPEYDLLETAIRLKGYDKKQREANYFPSLFGFANYGGGSQVDKFKEIFQNDPTTNKSNWFQQGMVGLSLKVPIFDSWRNASSAKQAKIEQQKLQNDFENFKMGAELQVKVSQTSFTSALMDEQNTGRALTLSEKIYTKNRLKFKEGVGSSFELVQAEQEYTTNQLKKIQATLGVLNSKADLDKALGKK